MHLLHLLRSDSFAGVEQYLSDVAPALAARGHDVTVVGGDPARMVLALAPSRVRHLPARTTLDVARAALRAERPDLVHSHMTAAEVAAVGVLPILRRPIVTTLHFAKPRGSNVAGRVLWSPLPRFMAREIAISHFVAEHASPGATVIWNGVPAPTATPADRQRVVLVAQRFEPEKQTDVALAAWACSGLGAEGWELHLAGRGSKEADLRDQARTAGVEDSVRFLGHVDDVRRRVAEASIFLATAPVEPFGLAVVEAMAAATPVVACGGGAHDETVGPVPGAALFAGADVAAGLLRDLADDDGRRATYGEALRDRYRAEFTIDRHVDRLETVYGEVREERSSR